MTGTSRFSHIIWDWNGTLLDDVAWCIACVNAMLEKRGLPVLDSVGAYHGVFGFPVIDYYRRVGFDFDKEPFEKLAVEYIGLYHDDKNSASLFPDARAILAAFQSRGTRQIILSASETGNLITQMAPFGIEAYFDEILGAADIYAGGKSGLGKSYMERVRPENAVLIGDTAHDSETARALGVGCVLVANGHQGKDALLRCGAPVLDNLSQLLALL